MSNDINDTHRFGFEGSFALSLGVEQFIAYITKQKRLEEQFPPLPEMTEADRSIYNEDGLMKATRDLFPQLHQAWVTGPVAAFQQVMVALIGEEETKPDITLVCAQAREVVEWSSEYSPLIDWLSESRFNKLSGEVAAALSPLISRVEMLFKGESRFDVNVSCLHTKYDLGKAIECLDASQHCLFVSCLQILQEKLVVAEDRQKAQGWLLFRNTNPEVSQIAKALRETLDDFLTSNDLACAE